MQLHRMLLEVALLRIKTGCRRFTIGLTNAPVTRLAAYWRLLRVNELTLICDFGGEIFLVVHSCCYVASCSVVGLIQDTIIDLSGNVTHCCLCVWPSERSV